MKNKRCIISYIAGVILACVNVGILQVEAQPKYNVTFLPELEGDSVTDLNNLGEVVGSHVESEYTSSCYLYSNGNVTTWEHPGYVCYAAALNDAAQVAGFFQKIYGEEAFYAFLYSKGKITYLGGLPERSNYDFSRAWDINNAGQIAGWYSAYTFEGPVIFWQGNITEIGTNQKLGDSENAFGINDNYDSSGLGQVVGESLVKTSSGTSLLEPFLYSNGVMSTYNICCPEGQGEKCQGEGLKINNVGQIVGWCENSQAFLYNTADGSHSFIGNYSTAFPLDINDAGQIVWWLPTNSSHGFPALYTNGITYNLLDFIPSNVNLHYFIPAAINEKGQILAYTYSAPGALILTPIE